MINNYICADNFQIQGYLMKSLFKSFLDGSLSHSFLSKLQKHHDNMCV